jgi:FAD binding domain/Berberine and berberine like
MGITRRTFLIAAGIGATGAVAACASGTPGAPPTSTTTMPATTATTPKPMDYQALAGKLTGHVITPNAAGYDLARRSYNPLFDTRRPAAIAQCANTSDVQACVNAAVASHTPIAARSGGHSYAGYSTPDNALVVDLTGLSRVRVDGDTAVVGAGARLIDVYAGLAAVGRCLPAGSCPSVGVAGLTLGGGIGVLSRKYGLTCDRLVGATVVTADGQARTVSAGSDPDLFWALRGGGGGNFGIVTSFTFSTVPAPELTVFQLNYNAVADAFGAWQPWIAAAPNELWSNFNITGGAAPTCTIAGCYVGPAGPVNTMLNTLVAKAGAPTYRTVRTMGYLDAMRYFGGCATKSITMCEAQTQGTQWNREASRASSRMLTTPLSDPTKIVDAATGHDNMHLIIDALGGAVANVSATATAFPHRAAFASIQIYLKTTPAAAANATTQVTTVRDELVPIVGTAAYVNYIDATLPNWPQSYYGDNLPRLRQVAQTYDPTNTFTFAQAINRT